MDVASLLGWARSLLDSFGLTGALTALVVIGVAFELYRRFTDRG